MKTRFGVLVVVLASLAASGCKMCCPSYDYCSPTNPGAANDEWCGKERRGSIFTSYSAAGEQVLPGETIMDSSPAPAAAESEAEEQPNIVLPPAPAPQPSTRPMNYSRNASNTSTSARRTR